MRTSALALIFLLATAVAAHASSYETRSDHHAISIDVFPVAAGFQFNVTIVDVVTGTTLTPHLVGASGTLTEWSDDGGETSVHLTLRATDHELTANVEFRQGGTMVDQMQSTWSTTERHVLNTANAFRAGGDVRQPRLIHRVEPVYPEVARQGRITGIIIVEAVIGRDGVVKDAIILKSLPFLDDAALAAVKQWTFDPGTLNGKPVDVIFNLVVNFFPTPSNGDAPLRVGGDVKAPVVISRVEPIYTEEARKARIMGVVIVEAIIDRNGVVRNASVLKPLPFGLDQAALDAVKQWRFKPATRNGEPVDVIFNLIINFKLGPPAPLPPPPG